MKIYVATDLSVAGRAAIDRACQWANKLRAELTLLHIVQDPALAPAFTDDVGGDAAKARQELQSIAASVPGACRVLVQTAENVADAIVATAADADFLFLGTQGKPVFERLRLGSVAIKVLRHCKVPIVCCPPAQATH